MFLQIRLLLHVLHGRRNMFKIQTLQLLLGLVRVQNACVLVIWPVIATQPGIEGFVLSWATRPVGVTQLLNLKLSRPPRLSQKTLVLMLQHWWSRRKTSLIPVPITRGTFFSGRLFTFPEQQYTSIATVFFAICKLQRCNDELPVRPHALRATRHACGSRVAAAGSGPCCPRR